MKETKLNQGNQRIYYNAALPEKLEFNFTIFLSRLKLKTMCVAT